jgi:hypothetical protein
MPLIQPSACTECNSYSIEHTRDNKACMCSPGSRRSRPLSKTVPSPTWKSLWGLLAPLLQTGVGISQGAHPLAAWQNVSSKRLRAPRKNKLAHGSTLLLTVPALRSHCRRRKSTFLSRAAFLPLLPQRPTDPPSAVGWAPQQPRDLLPLSRRMSHNMHNAFLLLNYAQLLRLERAATLIIDANTTIWLHQKDVKIAQGKQWNNFHGESNFFVKVLAFNARWIIFKDCFKGYF